MEGAADDADLSGAEAELEAVAEALERLDAGTYGTCAVCGATLAGDRLVADPTLRTCPEHGG